MALQSIQSGTMYAVNMVELIFPILIAFKKQSCVWQQLKIAKACYAFICVCIGLHILKLEVHTAHVFTYVTKNRNQILSSHNQCH